jgi:hypothetical protein
MATQSVRIGWRPYVNLATATYLLDTYTGASAAFSLRKLISTYTGPVVRVRRSNDNAEQNIEFGSDGGLNTTALLSFVGARNVMAYSEEFDNGYWHKNDVSIVINATASPNGTVTADLLREGTSLWNHSLGKNTTNGYTAGTSYNASVYVKKGTGSLAPDNIAFGFGETNSTTMPYVIFNILTGSVVTSGNPTADSDFGYSIEDAGNGWWRIAIWGTVTITSSTRTQIPYVRFTNNQTTLPGQYTGNINRDMFVWGYQFNSALNNTSVLTTKPYNKTTTVVAGDGYVTTWYNQISINNLVQTTAANQPQIVSSATVITSNGKPSVLYDGTNDQFNAATIVIGSDVTSTNTGGKPSTVFSVFDLNSAYSGTNEYPIFGGTSNYSSRFSINANKYYFINDTVIGSGLSSNMTATTGTKLGTVLFSGTNDKLRINGIESISGSVGNLGNGGNFIGRSWLGKFFYGKISEVVIYSVNDKSANFTDIESNINTYYSIYTPIITNGLVLNLDASSKNPGTGSTWSDMSASGYNGTLVNGPIFATANDGSISFDGVNDYINFGDVLDMGTKSYTINVWVKLNSGGAHTFVSKARAAQQNFRFAVGTYDYKISAFMQGNSSFNNAGVGVDINPYGSTTLTTNTWYMMTYVFDRSSRLSLYLNGVKETITGSYPDLSSAVGANADVISQWNGLDFQSDNPFRIGSYTGSDNSTPINMTNGNIGSVQIYNRVLSQEEITQNFNTTKSRFGL